MSLHEVYKVIVILPDIFLVYVYVIYMKFSANNVMDSVFNALVVVVVKVYLSIRDLSKQLIGH